MLQKIHICHSLLAGNFFPAIIDNKFNIWSTIIMIIVHLNFVGNGLQLCCEAPIGRIPENLSRPQSDWWIGHHLLYEGRSKIFGQWRFGHRYVSPYEGFLWQPDQCYFCGSFHSSSECPFMQASKKGSTFVCWLQHVQSISRDLIWMACSVFILLLGFNFSRNIITCLWHCGIINAIPLQVLAVF